jgi:hypothetical protein
MICCPGDDSPSLAGAPPAPSPGSGPLSIPYISYI